MTIPFDYFLLNRMEYTTDREENILENGENAGCQHFLHFPKCFQKPLFKGCNDLKLCLKGQKSQKLIIHEFLSCIINLYGLCDRRSGLVVRASAS